MQLPISIRRVFPSRTELKNVIQSFSKKERIVFYSLIFILTGSLLGMLFSINRAFLVTVPREGGTIVEGVLGTPRFVNPVLALSDTDRDLSTLIYSGLMRKTDTGEFIPDLAEKYEISADGLTYTFTLRDASFQDGSPLTANDVLYTINTIKDPLIKSPKKANWDGVSISSPDEHTVVFTLKQKYATFLENTVIGIIPSGKWKDLSPEQFSLSNLNINAVGSGPYAIKSVTKTRDGIPLSFTLSSFKKYALGKPYIDKIIFKFYANEQELVDAYENGSVTRVSAISPASANKLAGLPNTEVLKAPLARVFGVYFNQNENPIFTDKKVIHALSLAVDRNAIISDILHGYGTAIGSPVPPNLLQEDIVDENQLYNLEEAENTLTKAGWTKNELGKWEKKDKKETVALKFAIATSDTPELSDTAKKIADNLNNFGADVEVKIFETGTLNQTIIRPRKYEALFFGEVINHESDLFAFWHSSERNDPGLNIALYTNPKVDKILEQASGTLDEAARDTLYQSFEKEVINDSPAIFVYTPDFIYVTRNQIKNLTLDKISMPLDRFAGVYTWYSETEKVWKLFLNK